ncbi:hypothetical protein [Pseudorhodobacter ferrugineus]|uniref:hypothetical protein n=1 Tax=Pseudorhodobacter ferrugineus TaxID=77008 RepID=UPI0003B43185|nr:hypothetical protein [Pseudorhodobacter ferrugineus]
MTDAKHTPGPWTVDGKYVQCSKDVAQSVGKRGITVADCRVVNGNNDAHLIAAAPDLLEALVLLLQVNDGVPMMGIEASRRIEFARAAIAKAKGDPT